MRLVFILLLPFFLYSNTNILVSVYPENIINGETFLIKVKLKNNNTKIISLSAKFNKTTFKSLKDNENLIIPVSYYTKAATYDVIIFCETNNGKKISEAFNIEIKNGKYLSEKLKVSTKNTTYTKKILERIAVESKETKKVYSLFSEKYWSEEFIKPLNSKITSQYGKKRIFNNKIQSYHSGVDFRAPMNTQIIASNSGIVRVAKNRFFAGNSIIIDHGEGIFTTYYHLNSLLVKEGDEVSKGHIIALSGNSGRVTGPHLHFGAVVQGVGTNPIVLIENLKLLK